MKITSYVWATRFRRLARDYEHLPGVLASPHFLIFACIMLHQLMAYRLDVNVRGVRYRNQKA